MLIKYLFADSCSGWPNGTKRDKQLAVDNCQLNITHFGEKWNANKFRNVATVGRWLESGWAGHLKAPTTWVIDVLLVHLHKFVHQNMHTYLCVSVRVCSAALRHLPTAVILTVIAVFGQMAVSYWHKRSAVCLDFYRAFLWMAVFNKRSACGGRKLLFAVKLNGNLSYVGICHKQKVFNDSWIDIRCMYENVQIVGVGGSYEYTR